MLEDLWCNAPVAPYSNLSHRLLLRPVTIKAEQPPAMLSCLRAWGQGYSIVLFPFQGDCSKGVHGGEYSRSAGAGRLPYLLPEPQHLCLPGSLPLSAMGKAQAELRARGAYAAGLSLEHHSLGKPLIPPPLPATKPAQTPLPLFQLPKMIPRAAHA